MDLQGIPVRRVGEAAMKKLSSILILAIAIAAPSRIFAQESREYAVKAALLHKFVEFIEWPSESGDANSPIEICVLGQDPFGASLETIQGKVVRGRRLSIRRLGDSDAASACSVLFISSSERS